MSLRARIALYLVVVHLAFGGLALILLRQAPVWLFAVEVAFLLSLLTGISLTRHVLRSVELGGAAALMIREQELTSRVRTVGDPHVDALIGVYNEMVDTLRGERARVQEQHHFLGLVLKASPMGMVILDFDRRITEINPAAERLLEVRREAVIGQHVDRLESPLGRRLTALPDGGSGIVALSGPRRLRCHHGTFVDRGFRRSFLVVEELTEEVRRVERAAYEKIIRVMSHEVNNSVTSSNSLLRSSLNYSAELSGESRADFERALGIVIDRTEQLNLFMRRFADVFRLPPPVREPQDLEALVAPMVRLIAARGESAGITWEWDVTLHVTVSVDRGQFEQAVINIVKNAVEAAGPSGRVRIVIAREGAGRPVLTVEDSGPGPSLEAQAHLFTPFFSTRPNGQGIGLTLVQEILTAHGFEFTLQHPPGGCTQFVVRM